MKTTSCLNNFIKAIEFVAGTIVIVLFIMDINNYVTKYSVIAVILCNFIELVLYFFTKNKVKEK